MTCKLMRFRPLFSAILCLALCSVFVFTAQAASISELLGFLPEGCQFAVALPNIESVEKEAAPLLQLPFASEADAFAAALGGDTFSEGLEKCGINIKAPAVLFTRFDSPRDVVFGGILQVKDAAAASSAVAGLVAGSSEEVDLRGDLKASYVDSSHVGYFMNGDKLFIASSLSMLNHFADRIQAPQAIRYNPGNREEVVAFTRIDLLDKSGLLDSVPQLAKVKPIVDTLRPFSDELILAIGEVAGQAYLRAAAHDSSNAPVPSPGALGLHGFMNPEAPLVANLRLTPELINALSMAMVAEPATRQVGGYIRVAAGLLGDELALSFNSLKDGDVPDALIAAKVKQASTVPNLLKLIAKIDAPAYQFADNDVYVVEKVADGTDLHIAVAGDTLVVTPGKEELKTSVDAFNQTSGTSGVDSGIVNQGVFGFISLDGAKAAKVLPPNLLPANLDLSKISLALTLGIDGEWREMVLSSPKGFAGFASLLEDLI